MGYPGLAVQEYLIEGSKEVRLKRLTTVECDSYRIFKAVYQISRISRQTQQSSGKRLAVDLFSFSLSSERYKYIALVTDRATE